MFPSSIAAIPPGALDLTGEAVRRRRVLQRAAMGALEKAGYEELIPPTFEYEDTFLRAGGPGVAERLVRFPDRDGRILALRYDFTASLARVAATTFSSANRPLRLCYSGKVYRQEPERGGRPREMLQVGAELLGQGDLQADVEIVRLTLGLLSAAGLRDFQLNLGHVGVLAAGLEAIEEPLRSEVRRWIDRKDRGSLRRAVAHLSGDACALTTLPFVIGRRDALEEAARHRSAGVAAGARTPAGSRCGVERLRAHPRGVRSGRGPRAGLLHRDPLRALRGRSRSSRGRGRTVRRSDGPIRPADARGGSVAGPGYDRRGGGVTRMRVALAKGRLFEPSVARFRSAGIAISDDGGRKLLIPSSDPSIDFLVVKPGDVPVYVESGAADLGITGTDVLRESGADVLEPLELQFGFCRLVVATPAAAPYPALPGGVTARVATKYPRLAQAFFAAAGRPVDIIQVGGSVEVAPLLNLSHWIVDLVDTGNTLRANGLVERETILQCGAVLVANRASQKLKLDAYLDLMERLERVPQS